MDMIFGSDQEYADIPGNTDENHIGYKEKNEELEKLNQELGKLNLELKTLDQMKSNLLSNVSHELRTPLVAIKGYTDLIFKEKIGPVNPQQKRGLEISLKSIDRLISLIDNLLNFSKMEMGFEKLKLSTFNLIDVAEQETQLIKSRA
ncbi:MAG: HAMP domain-containing sensor histidine kinase, partial [Candidatus Eremiobacterota bacterium]